MFISLCIIIPFIIFILAFEGKLHISKTSGHAVSSAYYTSTYNHTDQEDMINRGEQS